MTWNKEKYIEEVINTFKNQSRDREGINLLKIDFLESETIEDHEESEEGTMPRELVRPIEKNNYMWQRINSRNNKK